MEDSSLFVFTITCSYVGHENKHATAVVHYDHLYVQCIVQNKELTFPTTLGCPIQEGMLINFQKFFPPSALIKTPIYQFWRNSAQDSTRFLYEIVFEK